MIYLLASILSSTSIYIIFRIAKNYSCQLSVLITLNYLVASLLGFCFLLRFNFSTFLHNNSWIIYAVALGVLFIAMFFLIGNSSQKAGIAVTTLANKLSLVFPVVFSLCFFNEQVTSLKYLGLLVAITAVLLTLYKKDVKNTRPEFFILPLLLFLGSGIIDSLIKYIQATQITSNQTAAFSSFVFFVAFICGTFISLFRLKKGNKNINSPTLILGFLLGLANFGSLFFFINALNNSQIESSLVFALNNMVIVALSAIVGFYFFKEKLNKINASGIVLAVISLYILLQ